MHDSKPSFQISVFKPNGLKHDSCNEGKYCLLLYRFLYQPASQPNYFEILKKYFIIDSTEKAAINPARLFRKEAESIAANDKCNSV